MVHKALPSFTYDPVTNWHELMGRSNRFQPHKEMLLQTNDITGKNQRLLEDLFSGPQVYTPLHEIRMLKLVEANIVI